MQGAKAPVNLLINQYGVACGCIKVSLQANILSAAFILHTTINQVTPNFINRNFYNKIYNTPKQKPKRIVC